MTERLVQALMTIALGSTIGIAAAVLTGFFIFRRRMVAWKLPLIRAGFVWVSLCCAASAIWLVVDGVAG